MPIRSDKFLRVIPVVALLLSLHVALTFIISIGQSPTGVCIVASVEKQYSIIKAINRYSSVLILKNQTNLKLITLIDL